MIIVRFKGRRAFHAIAKPELTDTEKEWVKAGKMLPTETTVCGWDVPARHERHPAGEPTCIRCRYALGLQPHKNDEKIAELAVGIERIIARANRYHWKPRRLRGELRMALEKELDEGLNPKLWYAAVRKASGGKGIRNLPDPRQLLLDQLLAEKKSRRAS